MDFAKSARFFCSTWWDGGTSPACGLQTHGNDELAKGINSRKEFLWGHFVGKENLYNNLRLAAVI